MWWDQFEEIRFESTSPDNLFWIKSREKCLNCRFGGNLLFGPCPLLIRYWGRGGKRNFSMGSTRFAQADSVCSAFSAS